ncbi:MAG: hypothetical protein A3B68_08655 [Candidatus Melainabacteria bacterium RIFCSPHIGHO2_02_FULL_34_12]|nr:MAG: hypothetical protein A3B68_08655 [Candidatus Melainabacteria bacterium RIFCSPHIGHO2_02_FULL_34_12]
MDLKQIKNQYGLSELEVYKQDTATQKVIFTANELKQLDSQYTEGISLRLIKNKKLGFSARYGKYDLDEMIKEALTISEYSPEVNFEFPEKADNNSKNNERVCLVPAPTSTIDLNLFKTKGENIIDIVQNKTKGTLIDVVFELSHQNEILKNSKDLMTNFNKILYSFSVNLRETNENDFIEIYTAVTEEQIPDYLSYLQEILTLYSFAKKHSDIKSGKCPVLFTQRALKDLLDIIESALNGKMVNERSSPWHDKLGKKVLSEKITLKQDPGFGFMARGYDDEGNEIKKMNLVTNGILENFYFDLITAGRGMPRHAPTGNGFKPSLALPPEPSLLNLILSPGKKSLDEIIKSIDYGLMVDQTMGGLSTNISGNMSLNIDMGFLIEKGEIKGRVKDTMISGNIYNALNNVIDLSNESKCYWSQIYNPDMLLDGFTITSK